MARCVGGTVWGFTDSDSWIPGTLPGQGAATPYDENYVPKPAYGGIAEALAWAGGGDPPPTGSSCAATYTMRSQWNSGLTAGVTVRDTGTAPIDGWSVRWTCGGG